MFSSLGTGIAELLVALVVLVVPGVLYILSLRRALERCAPTSRTMPPDKVWLLLIPFFNLVWHFFVVSNLARSLGNEFKSRGATNAGPKPGKSVGFAMCVLPLGGLLPAVPRNGVVAFFFAGLICWAVYWVKIVGYSRTLGPVHESGTAAHQIAERQPPYLLIGIAGLLASVLLPIIGSAIWLSNGRNESQPDHRTVAEVFHGGEQVLGKHILVSGDVEDGSIQRVGNTIQFVLAIDDRRLTVIYTGPDPLPDSFRSGAQVVADGKLYPDQVFRASKVRLSARSR